MSSKIKDLTSGPIMPTLLGVALPLMGTSFLTMAYNLLTMAWVGRLATSHGYYNNAIGAIGILLWLTTALGLVGMIGAEISVGQSIGAKKLKRAREFASTATTTAFGLSICWSIFVFINAPLLLSFHKLDESIVAEAVVFLRMVAFLFPFQFITYTFIGVYNGAGRSIIPFKYISIGLILNMVIDPILMFNYPVSDNLSFGFNMGFYGAAVGTMIAQIIVFLIFVYKLKVRGGIIGTYKLFIRPKRLYLFRIIYLGLPVAITGAFHAFTSFALAGIAAHYDPRNGVTSLTTGGQIEGLTWNTASGFSTALSAFTAQNYAANKLNRGKTAYKYTLFTLGGIGFIVSMLFMFAGKEIFGIIVPRPDAIMAGGKYIFIMGTVQIFMMIEISSQGMFNGLGQTIQPSIIIMGFNLLRIPLCYYGAKYISPSDPIIGVWCVMALTTACKGIILPLWFYQTTKRIEKKKSLTNILA